jgi:hypothetical protein
MGDPRVGIGRPDEGIVQIFCRIREQVKCCKVMFVIGFDDPDRIRHRIRLNDSVEHFVQCVRHNISVLLSEVEITQFITAPPLNGYRTAATLCRCNTSIV